MSLAFQGDRLYAADGNGGILFHPANGPGAWTATAYGVGLQVTAFDGRLYAVREYGALAEPWENTGWKNSDTGYFKAIYPAETWLAGFDMDNYRLLACGETEPFACRKPAMAGFPSKRLHYWTFAVLNGFTDMAATGNSTLVLLDSLYLTRDRGETWINAGANPAGDSPGQTVFLAAYAGEFWLGGKGGLFRGDGSPEAGSRSPSQASGVRPRPLSSGPAGICSSPPMTAYSRAGDGGRPGPTSARA